MRASQQRPSAGRAKTTYERIKDRAKARSAALVLAGQDIAPLPAVRDPARRQKADGDFRFFCDSYYGQLFNLPWSADHLKVIKAIQRVVMDHEMLAFAMPRGTGKTSLCMVAVQWAILSGNHHFVYLVTSAQDAALWILANIKRHLGTNEELAADYPEVLYPIRRLEGEARRCIGQRYYGQATMIGWGSEEIVLPTMPGSRCSGAIIRVAGITGHIRGALHVKPDGKTIRPSLVICDDPQTDQSAKSPIQTAERVWILNGAIRGLAGPGKKTAIIVPCTVIQPGDLADQLLDRQKNPHWQGQRTKLIYKFPENERLWTEYYRRRDSSFRQGGNAAEATEFYREHQAEMDAGGLAAWAQRYNTDEISAIQHAMNLKHDNEEAFFAEYQNDPKLVSVTTSPILSVEQICAKVNGRSRGAVPLTCTKLTMFIDVHDSLLYYCVCGWEETFAGYVVDYGTLPHQPRPFFAMQSATNTLGRQFAGLGPDGAIRAGLDVLVSTYLGKDFTRGQGLARIDRLLVDMGYKPNIVAAVKHKVGGSAMMLYRGFGIHAGRQPMSAWPRRPGEQRGQHWVAPNVSKSTEFPHVLADVNYWKTFVHTRLATPAGEPGSLSLFGKEREHDLFAYHLAKSETWAPVTGWGRTVQEWTLLPAKPDNHWFDCLVGCAVAASMCGISMPGMAAAPRQRGKIRMSDYQQASYETD